MLKKTLIATAVIGATLLAAATLMPVVAQSRSVAMSASPAPAVQTADSGRSVKADARAEASVGSKRSDAEHDRRGGDPQRSKAKKDHDESDD